MASLAALAVIGLALGPSYTGVIPCERQAETIASAEQDFDARRAELGLIGTAPMWGLERVARKAPIERVAKPAAVEWVVEISSARDATH